jgi:2,3,4,5-tetrahydropyridine-2-carboxylate N-succinyltransferase
MTEISVSDLQTEITAAWERRDEISTATQGPIRTAVEETLALLDAGRVRVAERDADGVWVTRQWAKQAILLSFRLNPNTVMRAGALGGAVGPWWDKVPSKFDGWEAPQFEAAGFRAVPGSIVRRGAFVAKGAVLMPSFVNIGAYVDEGTMVDTWTTVGSCAQIGRNVHLSGGVGIGGVLEPLQAHPTIIEDDCFIGARAEVAEGVVVRQGAVISMGVYINASTPIIDRKTGEVHRGEVPAYSVVVSGSRPDPYGGPSPYCAIIMKTVDAQTRSKTSVNELLRD